MRGGRGLDAEVGGYGEMTGGRRTSCCRRGGGGRGTERGSGYSGVVDSHSEERQEAEAGRGDGRQVQGQSRSKQ